MKFIEKVLKFFGEAIAEWAADTRLPYDTIPEDRSHR